MTFEREALPTEKPLPAGAPIAADADHSPHATMHPDAERDIDTSSGDAAKKAFLRRTEKLLKKPGGKQSGAPLSRPMFAALSKALKAYKKNDFIAAIKYASEATKIDENNSQGFHILAMGLEKIGELHRALVMYERALELDPGDSEIYMNLGFTAWRLELLDAAAKFFQIYIQMKPDVWAGYNNLAGVLREKGDFDQAIDLLRSTIYRMPEVAELWNTLGTVLYERGDLEEAITFYEEAIRLEPRMGRTYHNLAYTLDHMSRCDEALPIHQKAVKLLKGDLKNHTEAEHGLGICEVAVGDLENGWAHVEARHRPQFNGNVLFAIDAPQWQGEDLAGKTLVVVGEQGIGDELMFANPFPDLIEALGPEGTLYICCDRRLVPLFERTYPQAKVRTYANTRHNGKLVRFLPWAKAEDAQFDYFVTMGSVMTHLRTSLDAFPAVSPKLTPDPARIAHWRGQLEALGPGPYVGICWKSMVMNTRRRKYFGPIEYWGPLLQAPGVTFVNLQYGDCSEDIAFARDKFGVTIHELEGIDLKQDLDECAALSAALDLVISAPTAAGMMAGSIGTELWLLTPGIVWPMCGQENYPWYDNNRVFYPEEFADWENVMPRLAAELERFGEENRS